MLGWIGNYFERKWSWLNGDILEIACRIWRDLWRASIRIGGVPTEFWTSTFRIGVNLTHNTTRGCLAYSTLNVSGFYQCCTNIDGVGPSHSFVIERTHSIQAASPISCQPCAIGYAISRHSALLLGDNYMANMKIWRIVSPWMSLRVVL